MINQRVEMYEKILEKQMKIDLEKMESKLLKRTDSMKTTQAAFIVTLNTAVKAIAECFAFVPNPRRVKIVNEMEDRILREILEGSLPKYREFDVEFKKEMAINLLGGEKPSIGGKRLIGGEGPT